MQNTVLSLIGEQAKKMPGKVALVFNDEVVTYEELDRRSNQVARFLQNCHNIGPGSPVAFLCERSIKLIIGMAGILKLGGICIPVEPSTPAGLVRSILRDSGAEFLLTDRVFPDNPICRQDILNLNKIRRENHDAVINEDGRTGRCLLLYMPEYGDRVNGMNVTHDDMMRFVTGINQQARITGDDIMLLTGSPMAEGIVQEIFWALSAGVTIVIHPCERSVGELDRYLADDPVRMDFSIFFFANYDIKADDKYKLLTDAVKYADVAGFKGVWTPERHFHEFGGLFPNPSVISCALAAITERIELRCGSVVSPLHDCLRIAEEWSVVDNLSMGRAALSFASGWNINDFALFPENYDKRHAVMYAQIESIRKLWKGEPVVRTNGLGKQVEVHTFPKPVQETLPVWITAAGNEATFIAAGETGADLLTHLLGQDLQSLAGKIRLYRKAIRHHGPGGSSGRVAIMLHTYVGDDMNEVMDVAEKPFTEYLESAVGLSKILYEEAGLNEAEIPEEDKRIMLKHSFNRYSRNAALIGTPDSCLEIIRKLREIGVDEIACLCDFGIGQSKVMEGLAVLRELKDRCNPYEHATHGPITIWAGEPSQMNGILRRPGSGFFLSSLRSIFEKGKLVSSLDVINAFNRHKATLPRAEAREYYPASAEQGRLFNEWLSNCKLIPDCISRAYRIIGEYDVADIRKALERLTKRHRILRTGYFIEDGKVFQRFFDTAPPDLHQEYTGLPDLSGGRPARFGLLRKEDGDYLVISIHRIAADEHSFYLLEQELNAVFNGEEQRHVSSEYTDYVCRHEYERQFHKPEGKRAFWRDTLSGQLPSPEYPVIRSRDTLEIVSRSRKELAIRSELFRKICGPAMSFTMPIHLPLLSAFLILLSKITDETDIVIETFVPARTEELQQVIGPFERAFPLRAKVEGTIGYRDFVQLIRKYLQEGLENLELPYHEMLDLAGKERNHKISGIYFSFGSDPEPGVEVAGRGFDCQNRIELSGRPGYELGMEVAQRNGKLRIELVYCEQLYGGDIIGLFEQYYVNILEQVAGRESIILEDIEPGVSVRTL